MVQSTDCIRKSGCGCGGQAAADCLINFFTGNMIGNSLFVLMISAVLALVLPIVAIFRAGSGGGLAMYWVGMAALSLTSLVILVLNGMSYQKDDVSTVRHYAFSAVLPVVAVVFSVIFWRRRGSLGSSLGGGDWSG